MRPLLLLLGLSACSDARYVLELEPILTPNQEDILVDGLEIRIVLDRGNGAFKELTPTTLSDGLAEAAQAGELVDTWVTVLALADSNTAQAFDPSKLVAYGEVGPLDLSRSGQPVRQPVLFGSTHGVGSLGSLERGAVQGAVAITSTGAAYVFGGAPEAGEAAKPSIFSAPATDSGDWTFRNVGKLPDPVMGARANVVEVNGAELILVTGGQSLHQDFGPYSSTAVLFDPATDEIVWKGETDQPHSQHLAMTLPNDRVMLASAGISTSNTVGTYPVIEIFNPTARTSRLVPDELPFGVWHFGATLMADGDRVLFCGGSVLDDADTARSLPVNSCAFVDIRGEGSLDGAPTLPTTLHMHAMATLPDGRVLITGGVTEPTLFSGQGDAIATAWLWDPEQPDAWMQLPDMAAPRAKHSMVALNDGTILIAGGAAVGSLLDLGVVDAPRCVEFFDPATLTFEVADICHGASTGVDLGLSFHPRSGVLILEGMQDAGLGGKRLGYVPARSAF